MNQPPPIQRHSLWADPRFQLKYSALIVGVAILILGALGALYLYTLSEQRRLVGINSTCLGSLPRSAEDAEFDAEVRTRLEEVDTRDSLLLFAAAAVLVAALAALSVRLTFRIVGPVRAVSGMLWRMSEGHMLPPRHLRQGDEFQFLEEDLLVLQESLARRAAADCALLERAARRLERGTPDPDLAAALDAASADRRARFHLEPRPTPDPPDRLEF